MNHETIEKNVGLLGVLIALVISVGGLVEIVPLYFAGAVHQPAPGVKPYDGAAARGPRHLRPRGLLQLPLADDPAVPRRRPSATATTRWPASRCTTIRSSSAPSAPGPDLARVGGRYTDDWHRVHLLNPRDVVPESNMPRLPVARRRHGRRRA